MYIHTYINGHHHIEQIYAYSIMKLFICPFLFRVPSSSASSASSSSTMTTMLDSLFWNKETESSRSVEGEVQSLPFEPPPLSLLRSSRLVRSQQILLLQDYGSFPFTPSFSDGALSLDTVILSFGALHW